MLQALLDNKIELTDRVVELANLCTNCNWCTERCSNNSFVGEVFVDVATILEAFRRELVERSRVPPKIRDFLKNIDKFGNPWGLARKKRGEWTEGTGISRYRPGDVFLYYVGCPGSYEPRAMRSAEALGKVLLESGLSFGVLDGDENCDGNDVKMLGEEGLFRALADKNIQQFKRLGVKKIVTLSPHAYNTIRNHYPRYDGNFEVMHYTQLLRDLIRSGKLDISKGVKARVTYHDPCFLGRYNKEYDASREILRDIPGIELVEMERNRENSFCCGGGGANFFTDLLGGGENSPSRIRVREAYSTGAEILAVACPICAIMLEDAIKDEELEEKLSVKDISEIVKESCQIRK
jgi:Fe-S oxidoreductase